MALPEPELIFVTSDDTLRHAIKTIDANRIQIVLVVDSARCLQGTVTDGDIRRGILRGVGLDEPVELVMNTHPVTARIGESPVELLGLMAARTLKQLPLIDEDGRVVGLELLDNLLHGAKLKENPVVVLAGGPGTRLRPLTERTPKPLLPVGDQPVLDLILNQLLTFGFHRIFISVNYLGSQIEDYFGDGRNYGVSIEYLREPEPLGTAGPLSLIPRPVELPCIAVNGDLLTKVSFERMLDFHSEGGFDLTIGVKDYPFQLPFGVLTTEGDRVVEFREKPTEVRLINAGVYVVEPDVIAMVPQSEYYNMDQLIEQVIRQPDKRVGAFPIHEYWIDIGTAPDYRRAQRDYSRYFEQ